MNQAHEFTEEEILWIDHGLCDLFIYFESRDYSEPHSKRAKQVQSLRKKIRKYARQNNWKCFA